MNRNEALIAKMHKAWDEAMARGDKLEKENLDLKHKYDALSNMYRERNQQWRELDAKIVAIMEVLDVYE